MKQEWRILLIEDDEDDYILTRHLLTEAFGQNYTLDWVQTWDEGVEEISRCRHDVYLVDYRLGEHNGLDIVRAATMARCNVPIILLTGQNNREIDLAAMQEGASDYLVKTEISAPLLERSIRYATERKQVESELATLAQYDSLTGLANRSLFFTMLDKSLAQAERNNTPLAVLLMDLDHFKEVNDTWGHDFGDMLLQEVGKRLATTVRGSDIVARLGGDEFSIIATSLASPEDVIQFAHKISKALNPPISIHGREFTISASTGVALYPSDSVDAGQLFKCADIALYQAKDDHQGRVRLYDAELAAKAREHRILETDIGRALRDKEFFLNFQPKVSSHNGTLQGVEALIRWNHRDRGVMQPATFIPIAENTGQIVDIGEWVLREACKQIAAWQIRGLPPISTAVNLSAMQFKRTKVVETVARILDETGISPDHLELEITEGTAMSSAEDMVEILTHLHDLGVKLSIDDFGTGYSSLSYLKRFPMDKLKIDQSYIRHINTNTNDSTIARAIVNLGSNLNMGIIAEGVETEAQLLHLRGLGCEEVQGYFISRPLTQHQFVDWYLTPEPLRRNGIH